MYFCIVIIAVIGSPAMVIIFVVDRLIIIEFLCKTHKCVYGKFKVVQKGST